MRVSISNIAWKNADEAAIAQFLQGVGIEGIDVAFTKYWPSPNDATPGALQAFREFWGHHGVHVVGMQSLIFGRPDLVLFGTDEARNQLSKYLRDVFQLASQIGAGPLVFGSPQNRRRGDLPEQRAMTIAVDFFSSLAETAEQEGVVLCIEPNPTEYGCDFITSTTSAISLVNSVNHSHFRLHLDAAIMTMSGEEIEPALDDAADYLAHFHVSEPHLGELGLGKVDHSRFAKALRRIGYRGWAAIEMRNGCRPSDIDTVSAAVNYTIEVYGS